MKNQGQQYSTIDDYIRSFPGHIQQKLEDMRGAIRELAPGAEEKISYRMPAFYLNGVLVYFAAFSKHIGFYPTSGGIAAFKSELAKYKHAKGSVQFPIDEPLPMGLIKKIVQFRIEENIKKKKK